MRLEVPTLLAVLFGAGSAEAKQWRYVGVHPLGATTFCSIEVAHVHKRAPYRATVLYRVHDAQYYFVGDPVEYGWVGLRHAYHGRHPIQISIGATHDCLIDGPHHHPFAPVVTAGFEVRSGVHWYVDPLPRHDVEIHVVRPSPRASIAVHLPGPHLPRPHVIPVPSLHVAPVVVEHRHSISVEHRHGKKKGHGHRHGRKGRR